MADENDNSPEKIGGVQARFIAESRAKIRELSIKISGGKLRRNELESPDEPNKRSDQIDGNGATDPTQGTGGFLHAARESLLDFGADGMRSADHRRKMRRRASLSKGSILDFRHALDEGDGKLEEAIREAYEVAGETVTDEQVAALARKTANEYDFVIGNPAPSSIRGTESLGEDDAITIFMDAHGNPALPPLREELPAFFTIAIPHLIRQRLFPAIGLMVMAGLYLWLRSDPNIVIGGLALVIGVFLGVDALAIWFRYQATAYGDDLLEVGEVACYVAAHLGSGGGGDGHGRERPLYPHELEEKARSRASSTGHVPQGVRV